MTKDEWKLFKQKQIELYDKYANSDDPNAHELLDEEWLEFLKSTFGIDLGHAE